MENREIPKWSCGILPYWNIGKAGEKGIGGGIAKRKSLVSTLLILLK